MKRALLVCLTLVATSAFASHRSHPEFKAAQRLVWALEDISDAAAIEGDNLRSHNWRGSQEWYGISQDARRLGWYINSRIIRRLESPHADFQRIERFLSNYHADFYKLQVRIEDCGFIPSRIRGALQRAKHNWHALEDHLAEGCGHIGPSPRPNPRPDPRPNPNPRPRPTPNDGKYHCTAKPNSSSNASYYGSGFTKPGAQNSALWQCENRHHQCRLVSCTSPSSRF